MIQAWSFNNQLSQGDTVKCQGLNLIETIQSHKWLIFDDIGNSYIETLLKLNIPELFNQCKRFKKPLIEEYYELNIVHGKFYLIRPYLQYLLKTGNFHNALDILISYQDRMDYSDIAHLETALIVAYEIRRSDIEIRQSAVKCLKNIWKNYKKRNGGIDLRLKQFFDENINMSDGNSGPYALGQILICKRCNERYINLYDDNANCSNNTKEVYIDPQSSKDLNSIQYCTRCCEKNMATCKSCGMKNRTIDVELGNKLVCGNCRADIK